MEIFAEIKSRISCKYYAQNILGLPLTADGDGWRSRSFRPDSMNATSLHISNDLWVDYGTGKGGDVIELCSEARYSGDRSAALHELARLCGIKFTRDSKIMKQYEENLDTLLKTIERWHSLLNDADRAYLHGRGITDKTIDALLIGRGDNSANTYGNHAGRLIIPYWRHNRVVYFASRAMDNPDISDKNPKYKKALIEDRNKSRAPLEHCVWGLDTISRNEAKPLVIAEGMFDAISFWQEGYRVISPITGRFSSEQMPDAIAASRHCGRVVMVFDNDERGAAFRVDMADRLFKAGVLFSTARIPHVFCGESIKDVSDYYQRGGNLAELVKEPVPIPVPPVEDGRKAKRPDYRAVPAADIYDRQQGIVYLARIQSAHGNITDADKDNNPDTIIGAENGRSVSGLITKHVSKAEAENALRETLRSYGRYKPSVLETYLVNVGHAVYASGLMDEAKIDELIKWALSCPLDREAKEWVLRKHDYMLLPKRGLFEYNGSVWKRIDEAVIKAHINKELGRFESARLVNNALTLILSTPSVVQPDVKLNTAPIFNFANGTLDLITGELRAHRREDYSTVQVSYQYDENAKCPRWEQFVYEVCAGNAERIAFLQEFFGYVLFEDCRHGKALILKGEGSNGKTIMLEIMTELFGGLDSGQITNLEMGAFDKPFQLVHLESSILNVSTEMRAGASMDDAIDNFKKIVTGDPISACHKGQEFYSFRSRSKLIFAGNDFFKSRDSSHALSRRLAFVEFSVQFSTDGEPLPTIAEMKALSDEDRKVLFEGAKRADPTLKKKLLKELSGIFNWVAIGYKRLTDRGCFVEIEDNRRMLTEFKLFAQPVTAYVQECCKDRSGRFTRKALYDDYKQWCEDNSHRPLSSVKFIRDFRRAIKDEGIECVEYVYLGARGFDF